MLTVATGLAYTNGLAESVDGLTVYVSSNGGAIAAVDVHAGTVAKTYQVGGLPQDLALSPDGGELYVADENGAVIAMTITTGAQRHLLAPGSFGLAVSLDGSQLWVTQPSVGKILVIDREQFLPLRTIVLARVPHRAGSCSMHRTTPSSPTKVGSCTSSVDAELTPRLAPSRSPAHFSSLTQPCNAARFRAPHRTASSLLDDASYSLPRPPR